MRNAVLVSTWIVAIFTSSLLTLSAAAANAATTTTTTTYLTYKDSKGRFTIDYPSHWNVTVAKNRFEPFDVKFTNSGLFASLAIRLSKLDLPGNDIEPLMSALPNFERFNVPNFELNQDIECKKYTINGNKACSMINTQTQDYISQTKAALMTVETLMNGTNYRFLYASTPDNFDSNLPIIDKMISSFRIPTTNGK